MPWILVIVGVIIWVIAANIDRVFNGGDVLGLALFVVGIMLLTKGKE